MGYSTRAGVTFLQVLVMDSFDLGFLSKYHLMGHELIQQWKTNKKSGRTLIMM